MNNDTGLIKISAYSICRKRKKEVLTKDNIIKNLEPSIKNKALIKVKAKDSDDEDYMAWKKPDVTAPIVTFTPPPDNATPGTSFSYKSNILTKKHLETFNVRQNQQMHVARAIFADGDDGFESLNGNNSNGSDGESRAKENDVQDASKTVELEQIKQEPSDAKTVTEVPKVDTNSKSIEESAPAKKENNVKSVDADSDAGAPTSSPSAAKRVGVRFRSSWVKDTIPRESSDDDFASIKKKQKVNIILLY